MGNLKDYETDRLGFLTGLAMDYGPIATFDRTTTVISDPELARQVLAGLGGAAVIPNNVMQEPISANELNEWPNARRLLNPVLRHRAVQRRRQRITTLVSDHLTARAGSLQNAVEFWEPLTASVATEFFFGTDAEELPAMTAAMLDALPAVVGNVFALPAAIPTPGRRHIRARFAALKVAIMPLLIARSSALDRHDDGATDLLRVRQRMHPQPSLDRLCNVLIGNLLASHTVPAAAIAWTVHLLGQHPSWLARVRDEANAVLHQRDQGKSSSHAGQATQAVLNEALRLFPPTWLISRKTVRPVDLGGYTLPANHTLLLSPYVLHRLPASFDEPGRFTPERWLSGRAEPQDFFGFGMGPRNCPGRDLAQMTVTTALASLAADYTFRTVGEPHADPRFTLVPRGLSVVTTPIQW